jgi:hypothetical protein
MRARHQLAWIAVFLLLLAATPVLAQDSPRSIIERAVTAHGGAERLSRLRAEKSTTQGKIFLPGKEGVVQFSDEITLQLPGRFKHVARVTDQNNKTTVIVQFIDGDKVLTTVDGQPHQLAAPALADLRIALELQKAARLVPLLKDPAYKLTLLNEEKVNNRQAYGVKVSAKGRKDLRLYFDHETGLLVKSEHGRDDGSGKEVLQEDFYGDFKEFGGFRRWTHIIMYRDGKKLLEAEVQDVKYFDKIDDAEFTKP